MAGTDSGASAAAGPEDASRCGCHGIGFAGLFATVVVLDLVAFGAGRRADDIDLTKVNTTLVIVSTHLVAFAGVLPRSSASRALAWVRARISSSRRLSVGHPLRASLFTAAAVGAAGVRAQDDL